jgi:hypothetical protein
LATISLKCIIFSGMWEKFQTRLLSWFEAKRDPPCDNFTTFSRIKFPFKEAYQEIFIFVGKHQVTM